MTKAFISGVAGAAVGIGFLTLAGVLAGKDQVTAQPSCAPKHAKERAVVYMKQDGRLECHIQPVGVFGEFDGRQKI